MPNKVYQFDTIELWRMRAYRQVFAGSVEDAVRAALNGQAQLYAREFMDEHPTRTLYIERVAQWKFGHDEKAKATTELARLVIASLRHATVGSGLILTIPFLHFRPGTPVVTVREWIRTAFADAKDIDSLLQEGEREPAVSEVV